MWILFSILCMAVLTAADLLGKKTVDSDELAPVMLRVSAMAVSLVFGGLIFVSGSGESGLPPWTLLYAHPLILASVCCTAASDFLYLRSLRHVGMSVMEAVSSLEGIAVFTGFLIIHFLTGGFQAVREMLEPARFLLICVVLVFTVLLTNTGPAADRTKAGPAGKNREKQRSVVGILLAVLAVLFGSADSLIGDSLLDTGEIGAFDLVMTLCFSFLLPLMFFTGSLILNNRKKKTVSRRTVRLSVLYAVLFVTQLFLGVLALSIDAVRTEILFLSYPVISILGAKLVLKEQYSRRQTVCIWVITIASAVFCLIDYI